MNHAPQNPGEKQNQSAKLQAYIDKECADYVKKRAFHRNIKQKTLINQIIREYMAVNPLP